MFGDVCGGNQKDLLDLPHPLRDELLRPSRALLYGGRTDADSGYKKRNTASHNGVEIVGAAVMRTQLCTFGVAVAIQRNYAESGDNNSTSRLFLLAPAAPLAQMEQEFLSQDMSPEFERVWCGVEADTLHSAHAAVASIQRGIGAFRFPSELFSGAHQVNTEGPLPLLAIGAPSNPREMRMAAGAVQMAIVEGSPGVYVGDSIEPLTCLAQQMVENADAAHRAIDIHTEFSQAAVTDQGLATRMVDVVDAEKLEDLLYRPVVTYLSVIVALRVDSDRTLSTGNFEVRIDALTRELPKLSTDVRRALSLKVSALSAAEVRERQMLASSAIGNVLNPYPPVDVPSMLAAMPRIGFVQSLVDEGAFDQLPGALSGFFERGFHSAELLRIKYKSDVHEYLSTLGGLLSHRHAIAMLSLACGSGRATSLHMFSAKGTCELRPRDLPRLAFAPWCLTLVVQSNGGGVAVLKTTGVQWEALVFSSKARDEIASIAPDMAPLAEVLLEELRATQQRLDAFLARETSDTVCAPPAAENSAVKRLKGTLRHFRQQMVAA